MTSEIALYYALVTLTGLISLMAFIAVTAASVTLALTVQILALPWDPERRVVLRVQHLLWGRALFFLTPSMSLTRQVEALEGEGPYIVVSNHASMLDIPACMGLDLPLRVVGKRALFSIPGMAWMLRLFGHIRVPGARKGEVAEFIGACRQTLDQGMSLLLFPEGTRTRDGRIQPFHRGAFRLAKDTGTPILPVVVRGSWYAYPRGYFIPRVLSQRMYLDVLPPVDPELRSTAKALSNEVRRRMEVFLDENHIEPDYPIPPQPTLERAR